MAVIEQSDEFGERSWLERVPPAYWVLGRSRFHGYVTARRGSLEETAGLKDEAVRAAMAFRPAEAISPAGRAAERLAELPYLRGNSVELLVDGDATFESILDGISAASDYVLFQFFIVHDDEIGRAVKERLIERARAGVRVAFLYDEVGSHDLPRSYKNELREAGVEVYDFHTRKGPRNQFQLNFRNHRKIVVVDGRVAWIGGHNVGDEYLGRDPKFGHWRDTHVRIEGPAALGAQLSFAEDWYWATGRTLDLNWNPVASDTGDIPVLIIPTGPADELETASLMFTHAINSARKRIWIASPYFVPDHSVLVALQLAGLRGVDVRILIPDRPDHIPVYLGAEGPKNVALAAEIARSRIGENFNGDRLWLKLIEKLSREPRFWAHEAAIVIDSAVRMVVDATGEVGKRDVDEVQIVLLRLDPVLALDGAGEGDPVEHDAVGADEGPAIHRSVDSNLRGRVSAQPCMQVLRRAATLHDGVAGNTQAQRVSARQHSLAYHPGAVCEKPATVPVERLEALENR